MHLERGSRGFEDDDRLRSTFIRELVLRQSATDDAVDREAQSRVPRTLVRYWHDLAELPEDVRGCLDSWEGLRDEGFEIRTYDDGSARAYVAENFGPLELKAFGRCRHPAMRSDYFRMCFLAKEGGMYVDADDVLVGDGWRSLFRDGRMRLQPLCYDIPASAMVSPGDFRRPDVAGDGRIFYVNNDPLVAPPGHPLMALALARSTERLLGPEQLPVIQATTGPGNMTIALALHANALEEIGKPPDFELLRNWDDIAEMRWNLSYRNDERNWRNVEGSGF